MMKPRIRILPDLDPPQLFWCGFFEGGYSPMFHVADVSLRDALRFYFRVLDADGILRPK